MSKDNQEIREKMTFAICSRINGEWKSCREEMCDGCGFILPRLKLAVKAVKQVETPTHRIAIVKKKPELPTPNMDIHTWRDYSPDMAYEKAINDMLANNFVQEEVNGTER